MKRTCTSCDRGLRKGACRRAWVLSPHGELALGLVCTRCALRALAFVVPPATTVPPACFACKRKPAAVCRECVAKLEAHVKELAAANIARVAHPIARAAVVPQ